MPGEVCRSGRRDRGVMGVGVEIAHGLRAFIGLLARGLKLRSNLQAHSEFRRIFAFWIDALRATPLPWPSFDAPPRRRDRIGPETVSHR